MLGQQMTCWLGTLQPVQAVCRTRGARPNRRRQTPQAEKRVDPGRRVRRPPAIVSCGDLTPEADDASLL